MPESNTLSSFFPQERPFDTEDPQEFGSEGVQSSEEAEPNGIRYSRGQDPFYLMHENQLASLLRRASAGEEPDALLAENWINTQVMHEDDQEMTLGDNDSAVIMVDLDEEDEDVR